MNDQLGPSAELANRLKGPDKAEPALEQGGRASGRPTDYSKQDFKFVFSLPFCWSKFLISFSALKFLAKGLERFEKFRRKRRREVLAENGRAASRPSSRGARSSSPVNHLFAKLLVPLILGLVVPTSRPALADDLPEAQPLVFMAFNEFGSGDGQHQRTTSPQTGGLFGSSSFASSSSSAEDGASLSPALIEARCLNSYESDDNCKQLNVITGPAAAAAASSQSPARDRSEAEDIITPIVIFESSSSVEPSQRPPASFFMAPPYFATSPPPTSGERQVPLGRQRQPLPTANDVFAASPATATILPAGPTLTRPSVGGPHLFVATPQPKTKGPKTTTLGRRCRDEDDADCDEPDEEQSPGGSSKGHSEDDEDEDDNDDRSAANESDGDRGRNQNGRSSSTAADNESSSGSSSNSNNNDNNNVLETGSGDGPAGDDEDSADDGDDSEAPLESSGNSDAGLATTTLQGLLEVTPVFVRPSKGGAGQTVSTMSTLGPLTSSSPPRQPGAEIEVVVHSTLPPSFPVTTSTLEAVGPDVDETVSRTESAPATVLPDDTFTSKPIFPSTGSSQSVSPSVPVPAQGLLDGDGQQASSNQVASEEDLFKFKPFPMDPDRDRDRSRLTTSLAGLATNKRDPEEVVSSSRPLPPSDHFWTTRPPVQPWMTTSQPQVAEPLPFMPTKLPAPRQPPGVDMLPTMLFWASIVVLATIAVIFAIMAAVIWRRNSSRRLELLQKARLLNGQNKPLVGSLSQPSHLMQPPPPPPPGGHQQPGLLSTYAPGKGLTLGKVTTSLAPAPNQDDGAGDGNDDDDDEADQLLAYGGQGASKDQLVDGSGNSLADDQRPARADRFNNQSSWSTEDPTTASSGSQRTQNSQQQLVQQQHLGGQIQPGQQQQQRSHYPNSLSDGRQNSSSISDSQCSPDAGQQLLAGLPPPPPPPPPPPVGPLQQQPVGLQMGPQVQEEAHVMMMAPSYHQRSPVDGPFNHYNGAPAALANHSPMHFASPVQNGPADKPRFLPSRSIEGLQQAGHVGFVAHNQQQVPFAADQPTFADYPQPPPQVLRPDHMTQPQVAGPSPQRIAMNPLATLGRRFPPGAGLNRNIYSEDSSSFMTTSPSLARTSSSSSFAFNLANQPPPIRAKPLIDADGRLINEYMSRANFAGNEGAPGGPPIFSRGDRSEAWYV